MTSASTLPKIIWLYGVGLLVLVSLGMPGIGLAEDPPKEEPVAQASEEEESEKPEVLEKEGSLDTLAEPSTVTVEETGEVEDEKLPGRLGPAEILINKRGDRIRIGLATQFNFSYDRTFAGGGATASSENGLSFRRLRTILGSSFLKGRIRSSLQLNLLPDALELIDLWLYFAPINHLAIRVGQFKIPFTRYRLQSFAALSLADWSPVSPMFGGERQLGLDVFNPTAGASGWEYSAGVFTGTNARGSHGVGLTEYYGETPDNRSDLTGSSAQTAFHPEVVARVAKNFSAIDTSANSDVMGGPLRSSLGLSVAWDAKPKAREDYVLRFGAEGLAKFYGFYFDAIGYLAWFEGNDSAAFGPWGVMVEGGHRFHRMWELALRYSFIGFPQALRDDAAAYAADQIGDGSDPAKNAQYGGVGQQKSEQDLAVALNTYILGNSLKAQLETGWSVDDTELGLQHALRVVAQLQFQF